MLEELSEGGGERGGIGGVGERGRRWILLPVWLVDCERGGVKEGVRGGG